MAELDPLHVRPEPLAGVQLWGIGGQTLQMKSIRRRSAQQCFDDVTAMHRGTIPDDHHTAGYLAEPMLQKGDHSCRMNRAVLASKIQLGLGRHGTDGREMIAGPPRPQDGRGPPGSIGADHTGQGIEAGFIEEEDRLPMGLSPFLMAGQVSSRQRAMATSSRWRARRAGFGGLQRIVLSKRPTCTGW